MGLTLVSPFLYLTYETISAKILYYRLQGYTMVTTVRLDEKREDKLSQIADILHKKKSDVLREALDYYAEYILEQKKEKFKQVVEKVKQADLKEHKNYEGTIDDGL